MAEEKKIKILISSPNEGGYNTVAGRAFKEPAEVEVTAVQLKMIQDEAPHVVVTIVEEKKVKTPPAPPAEKSTDEGVTVDKAVDKISKMTDIAQIRAYVKGDERKGVKDAAEAAIEALKE